VVSYLYPCIFVGFFEQKVVTGHFERRISFGYDADLGRVRAEFDGEILRVFVPRRTPTLTWYGETCE
jgi:HSP20 family molecular chaperone IbpA